jgi:hypothetical protein
MLFGLDCVLPVKSRTQCPAVRIIEGLRMLPPHSVCDALLVVTRATCQFTKDGAACPLTTLTEVAPTQAAQAQASASTLTTRIEKACERHCHRPPNASFLPHESTLSRTTVYHHSATTALNQQTARIPISGITGRTKRQSKLDVLKERCRVLLSELEQRGIFVPPISTEPSKAFRTRGAGNAQNKKTERRRGELQLLTRRVAQLEECLRDHGVDLPSHDGDEQVGNGSDGSE